MLGLVAARAAENRIWTATQVTLASGGRLDMRVHVDRADGSPLAEIWLEAKIDAPVSEAEAINANTGLRRTQLDAYLDEIAALPRSVSRILVLLAKLPPDHMDTRVAWLPWNTLYAAIRSDPDVDSQWHEMAHFLEETHVADESELAITPREAGSIQDFVRLFGKVSRILNEIDEMAGDLGFPKWGGMVKVKMGISSYLRTLGRLVLTHGGGIGSIEYGLMDSVGGDPEWIFQIRPGQPKSQSGNWYWSPDPSFTALLVNRFTTASSQVSVDWEVTPDPTIILRRRARYVDVHDHDKAVAWLSLSLRELDGAGVLELLKSNTPKASLADEPVMGGIGEEPDGVQ